MKRCHLKPCGVASGLLALLPWLLVGSDVTGRAAGAPAEGPGRTLASSARIAQSPAPAGHDGSEASPGAGSAGGRTAHERPQNGQDGSEEVVPRVLPEVTIRSFSLEHDRAVAMHPLGAPGPRRSASPAPLPERGGTAGVIEPESARPEPAELGTHAGADVDPARVPPSGQAPEVEVRVGDHGDYQRIVFEWPQAIKHDVRQQREQITVAFSRAGRIDFAGVRERLGTRLLEARAVGADVTESVVLRVLPGASMRSFRLKHDRIVVVDVFGGAAAPTGAAPADHPDPRPTKGAVQNQRARTAPSAEVAAANFEADDAPLPTVTVRVGEHGAFERVVFEWPEAIGHKVVQRRDRVTVSFSRRGRIDLSRLRDRFGERVLEAWAEGDAARSEVVLRVLPDAEVRSFALEDERGVVVDVFGAPAERGSARNGPHPAPDPVGELRRELEERDAVIDSLLARVEQLERGATLSGGDLDQIVAGRAPAPGEQSLPGPGARAVAAAEQPADKPASEQESVAGAGQDAAGAGQDAGSATAPTQPGQLEVDEDEIDRALERTLVQTGVLLLPTGQAEVEPFFSYTRDETDASMVVLADNGLSVGAGVEVRRNEFVSGQDLRFGMPFDSQVEFGFPYRFVEQSMVATVDMGGSQEVDHFGHGMGDTSIGVAKTLVRENGHWWPDLIGRVTWDAATGETTSNDVPLGGGFNELRGSLSAVKRQDPLAFVSGFSYETTFEKDGIKPGDQLGFSIGTVLAASPGTSLRFGLDQRFIDTAKSDGEEIDGSDSVIGTATIGASVVLGGGMLLDVAADIGLTDDAPAYAARASLPIRFNLPVY
jgi:hypothetical protein